MPTLPNNPVRLYNSLEDIEISIPYATEDADELELVTRRFVAWAQMIATHPNIAAQFGDRSRDHIQLATDLRKAMGNRRHSNVVLPIGKYFAAKMLTVLSRSIAAEPLPDFLQQEIEKWEEPRPFAGVLDQIES
jgi:hypothetical protein